MNAPPADLPKETLARYQALRDLLAEASFTGHFLPAMEAEERAALASLPDDASEMTLRRQFVRWKMSLRIAPDLAQFVQDIERRLSTGGKPKQTTL